MSLERKDRIRRLVEQLREAGLASVDTPEDARMVLERYHQGVGDLSGEAYGWLSELSICNPPRPNPKRQARRKKRTG